MLMNIKMALDALRDNKLRSFLTMLSIIIGVAAVIIVLGVGRGLDHQVSTEFKDQIYQGRSQIIFNKGKNEFEIPEYTTSKIANISRMSGVAAVEVSSQRNFKASYGNKIESELGVASIKESKTFDATNKIKQGRFFTDEELGERSNKVLLYEGTAQRLFQEENPIGKRIEIKGKFVEVIGVYGSVYPTGGRMLPSYIPYHSWENITGTKANDALTIIPINRDMVLEVGQQVADYLNETNFLEGRYAVLDLSDQLEQVDNQLGGIIRLVSTAAALSILVGGIGVMNIMYVSVLERKGEIGLRKAIGAKEKQIIFQFMVESIILTLLGGIIGSIIGITGSILLAISMGITNMILIDVIIYLFVAVVIVGLVAGLAPSIKAAGLEPVETLKDL